MTNRGEAYYCFGAAYTSQGYVNLLAPCQRCRNDQIVLLRGGPQTIRSSILRQAADDLLERGFSMEIYRHWANPKLVSGFRLISPGLMVLDDDLAEPPGAADSMMHSKVLDINVAWDEAQLNPHKKVICTLSWHTMQRMSIVASYLHELGIILRERKSYVADSMDFTAVNRTTQQTISEIFSRSREMAVLPTSSPLFVSAITPDGIDHSINTLVSGYKHFHLLRGEPGSGRSTILARLAEQAAMRGLATRSFHGPLEPERLEMLMIPSLSTAVIAGTVVRSFRPNDQPSLATLKVIELDGMIKKKRLALFQPEWLHAQHRFTELLESAVKQLALCKQNNETITSIYQEYVDQAVLQELSAQLLRTILGVIDRTR